MTPTDIMLTECHMEEIIRQREYYRHKSILERNSDASFGYKKFAKEFDQLVDEAWNAGYRTLNLNDHIIRLIPINQ